MNNIQMLIVSEDINKQDEIISLTKKYIPGIKVLYSETNIDSVSEYSNYFPELVIIDNKLEQAEACNILGFLKDFEGSENTYFVGLAYSEMEATEMLLHGFDDIILYPLEQHCAFLRMKSIQNIVLLKFKYKVLFQESVNEYNTNKIKSCLEHADSFEEYVSILFRENKKFTSFKLKFKNFEKIISDIGMNASIVLEQSIKSEVEELINEKVFVEKNGELKFSVIGVLPWDVELYAKNLNKKINEKKQKIIFSLYKEIKKPMNILNPIFDISFVKKENHISVNDFLSEFDYKSLQRKIA